MGRPLLVLALPLLLAGAGACGASKAPPSASASPAPAPSAEAAAPSDAPSDDPKPFAGVDVEPPASAAAPQAPPPGPEPTDECTPVGVDFEKRTRPKVRECYRKAKEKEPDLKGTVRIAVAIDMRGKIKSTKIIEKTLPDPVAKCMLEAVKKTPFPEASKCPGKDITIPVTFPTPR